MATENRKSWYNTGLVDDAEAILNVKSRGHFKIIPPTSGKTFGQALKGVHAGERFILTHLREGPKGDNHFFNIMCNGDGEVVIADPGGKPILEEEYKTIKESLGIDADKIKYISKKTGLRETVHEVVKKDKNGQRERVSIDGQHNGDLLDPQKDKNNCGPLCVDLAYRFMSGENGNSGPLRLNLGDDPDSPEYKKYMKELRASHAEMMHEPTFLSDLLLYSDGGPLPKRGYAALIVRIFEGIVDLPKDVANTVDYLQHNSDRQQNYKIRLERQKQRQMQRAGNGEIDAGGSFDRDEEIGRQEDTAAMKSGISISEHMSSKGRDDSEHATGTYHTPATPAPHSRGTGNGGITVRS